MDKQQPADVSEYIANFSGETKSRLEQLRALVTSQIPDAQEGIMYGLVGYKLHGKPLVYFGGFEHHIGFYATPTGHEAFATELAQYKQGKGSVQFPLDRTLPLDLVKRMIIFRRNMLNKE